MALLELLLAFGILLGAAVSDLLGQSAVLFLNRVPPARFLLCAMTGVGLFVASALGGCLGLWVLGMLAGLDLDLAACYRLVAFSHYPLLLGVFVFVPHLGAYLFHGLRALVFLNLVVAVGWATRAPLVTVTACCLPTWVLHFSLTHLEVLHLERFQAGLWRRLAGTE